jgi:AcrR family transcriptional regulator
MLLAAARERFGADGYVNTNLDDVAEQAGVTKPVLYRHFDSKQQLYAQLILEQAERMQLETRRALSAAPAESDRALVVLDATFAYLEHEPFAWRLLLPEQLDGFGADARRAVADAEALAGRQAMVLLRTFAPADEASGALEPTSELDQLWAATSIGIQSQLARWWHEHPDFDRAWVVDRARSVLSATAAAVFAGSATRQ